jgi:hypothetical protein
MIGPKVNVLLWESDDVQANNYYDLELELLELTTLAS